MTTEKLVLVPSIKIGAGLVQTTGVEREQTRLERTNKESSKINLLNFYLIWMRFLLKKFKNGAIQALEKLIGDPGHRGHMRAVAAVIDRVDPLQQNVSVNVRHEAPTVELTEQVIARIEELARRAGVAALPAPAPIDGDFVVVPNECDNRRRRTNRRHKPNGRR
jgi:hypothetical protein